MYTHLYVTYFSKDNKIRKVSVTDFHIIPPCNLLHIVILAIDCQSLQVYLIF
jgi:hypothetical protein